MRADTLTFLDFPTFSEQSRQRFAWISVLFQRMIVIGLTALVWFPQASQKSVISVFLVVVSEGFDRL